MKWRPYWYKMSARQKKGFIILMALSLVLMVMPDKLGRVEQFDWLEVGSAYFGMSEGKFMFFWILFTILCCTLVIAAVSYERRKKNELVTGVPFKRLCAP